MKKLIPLLLILLLSACTFEFNAETTVTCPCVVIKIESKTQEDKITMNRVYFQSTYNDTWFSYYTSHHYQIGDTIK